MEFLFGFIGCGNMGSALCRAVSKKYNKEDIAVFDRHPEKLDALKDVATISNSANEVALKSKFLFIGVKPQGYENTFNAIKEDLKNNKDVIIVSMAAGVSISGVEKYADGNFPVIRIMPNTPASVGEGIILYAPNGVTQESEEEFRKYFSSAGLVVKIDEEKMDKHTAITGCGPAFVYMFIDAMKKSAVSIGIDEADAEKFCAQTVLGSAKMVLAYGNADQLKINVCSPGGSTIEGVKSLEKDDLYSVVDRAVQASKKRTEEMKK